MRVLWYAGGCLMGGCCAAGEGGGDADSAGSAEAVQSGAVKTLLAHSVRVEIGVRRLPGAALKRLYFIAKKERGAGGCGGDGGAGGEGEQ